MRKYLFLGYFVFLYSTAAIAQNGNYIPFPSNMIVYTYESRASSDQGWYSISRWELQDDTLINALHYSKYFLAQANRYGTTPLPSGNLISMLSGGIRNDIPAKKVYFYSFDTQTEKLLYDFDLHVGDTLFKNDGYRFYHSLLDNKYTHVVDTVWVSRIDSVLMPNDNLYHKRFNFKCKYRFYSSEPYRIVTSDSIFFGANPNLALKINPLIEGVGADYEPITTYSFFEYNLHYNLFCRSINGKIAYSGMGVSPPPFMSKTNCNSIITNINDDGHENATVTLYPNPSNGKFNLMTTGSEVIFFEVRNLLGVKILSSAIENNKIEIDMSSQASGIYFVQAFYRNGISVTKKIMIE